MAAGSAEEAREVGPVNRVVPHDQLMNETMKLAERVKKGAPIAQKIIKRVLNRKCREAWDMMPTVFATEDVTEARGALLATRAPQFKGR